MKAVIFDCDGILVDSETLSCGAWVPVLERQGVSTQLSDIEEFIGRSEQAVLDHYRQLTGRELPDELIAEKEEEYFRTARNSLKSFPGLEEILTSLQQAQTPIAVASSGGHDKIRFSLETVGLLDFFPVICSVTDVSRGKPHPDLFLYSAEKLQVAPERCCVIEDSIPGIQAAVSAGMRAIGFTSSYAAPQLLAVGAHATFEHYRELPETLGSASR